MKHVRLALCLAFALAGCLGIDSGTSPGNPSFKDPVGTVPRPPPDTIRGFALYNRFPDAVYHVDRNPIDYKCTTTAVQLPFERRGDTAFGRISFRQDCALQMGATLYTDTLEPVLDFAVSGDRVLSRDSTGWHENQPWNGMPTLRPFDLWHPFEARTSDSLLRVEFLGDSCWAYVRLGKLSVAGGPPVLMHFYVAGFGPVYVNNRYSLMHGAYGEIIRLIRYRGFTAERIQADIDRIVAMVPPVAPSPP